MTLEPRKVQYELMLPWEFEAALEDCPTAFIPLGTLEWHGRQNCLGLDAVKAHELCIHAARRGGGVVLPPLFGGVGGVDEPHTVVMDVEPTLYSNLLEPWLVRLLEEMKRMGFKAVIVLTGHYGASQQMIVRETAVRLMQRLDMPILGIPEYFIAMDVGYYGDHGGAFETSIMMHLRPELVDLDQLEGFPPYQGIGGGDAKRDSSVELGEKFNETMISRLATLSRRMPTWDDAKRLEFLRMEQALVGSQLEAAGRTGNVWAAWQDLSPVVDYGRLLVEEAFAEIKALLV